MRDKPSSRIKQVRGQRRRGAVIVLAATMMIVMMAMLALSVDVGYMYTMQTQLQRSVDAAALAGAGQLVEGQDAATGKVVEYLVRNPVGRQVFVCDDDNIELLVTQFLQEHQEDLEVHLGHWNYQTRTMEISDLLPSTISVRMAYPNERLFFGPVIGTDTFDIVAESIAMYQPRDIMLVLDLSASMNDDSEFKSIGRFGREAVEAGLEQMWVELGSPQYGDMQVAPQYAVILGDEPSNGSLPQIGIEYRYTEIKVTSTKPIDKVIVQYSNGRRYAYNNISGNTATISGSGYASGKAIYYVWVKSGANDPDGNGYGEFFDLDSGSIKYRIRDALGLANVPYPYNSGDWTDYIDYCRDSDNQNADAGYRYRFGYLNLMNYWLDSKPSNYQTEDLWKVSAQPCKAVKNAVHVFMEYIQEVDTNDRVGLAIYNYSGDGDGHLECPLTSDFDAITDLSDHRQAGHYHSYTNIGGGMTVARQELEQNGRTGAFKMIVLMTDGLPNWVNGGYNQSGATNYVLDEADLAADRRYPIFTISLGANADTALMQEVADRTDTTHFNVPGGATMDDYDDDLKEAFREIADERPLKIVK